MANTRNVSFGKSIEGAPLPKLKKNVVIKSLWDVDEEEIARQLSLHAMSLFLKIRPQELLDQNWVNNVHFYTQKIEC